MLKSLANASGWLLAYCCIYSCICLFTIPKKQADICLNFTTRTADTETKNLVHNKNSTFSYFAFSSRKKCMHAAPRTACIVCAFCCKHFLLMPPFQFDALKGQLLYVILCWLNDELFKTRWQTRVHTLYTASNEYFCAAIFSSLAASAGYVGICWTQLHWRCDFIGSFSVFKRFDKMSISHFNIFDEILRFRFFALSFMFQLSYRGIFINLNKSIWFCMYSSALVFISKNIIRIL